MTALHRCLPACGPLAYVLFLLLLLQVEEHMVDGRLMKLLVHRKGSTRAFPPHHPLIPVDYQLTGAGSSVVWQAANGGTQQWVLGGGPCVTPVLAFTPVEMPGAVAVWLCAQASLC